MSASVIESNANPTYNKAQALRLYVEQSEMDALLGEDMERYKEALEKTGGVFDGIEPISRFHEAFEGPLDAAHAAAVVGLETEVFLEQIRENVGLQNLGLLVLDSNGSMKRDTWTSSFRDIVFALDFPESFTPPAVITPPKPIPGAVVQIPDPNLRAAIAEALGKSPNTPITVEEMEGLVKLEARNRDIQDLTGLQFAINLNELFLQMNQISDLSPIAGLIKLRDLGLARNSVSDISLLKDLKNLKGLGCSHNPISDISPLAGLTELRSLHIDRTLHKGLSPLAGLINLASLNIVGNNFTDLSPLAGLVNLKRLWFSSKTASDLSPLSGLINLEIVHAWGNPISDLSPLGGLTKLERIDFCGTDISDLTPLVGLTGLKELVLIDSDISDISPLAGLTGLNRLNLSDNDISDVSPLAGLTNLKWLDVQSNEISDISPLDEFRENIKLIWFNNPGFPKGGPKIEGPWLWVVLPEARLDSSTDLLSKASGGNVTEVEVATRGATAGKACWG